MSAITEAARGQPCQVRVPSYCNGNVETVVAAHYRSISLGAGTGIKPSDILCAWACAPCHDCIDGRIRTNYTRNELRLMHAEGVMRTLLKLVDMGLMTTSAKDCEHGS